MFISLCNKLIEAAKKAFDKEEVMTEDEWKRLSRDYDFNTEKADQGNVLILRDKAAEVTSIYMKRGNVYVKTCETSYR